MNTGEIQDFDLEEAKIIISLKNDQISSLKATLRTAEIKNNLRQADLKHKIDQYEHKSKAGEAKFKKSQENNSKIKALFDQELKRLQKQMEKSKQNSEKLLAQSHQKERELNVTVFEEKLKVQKEKQYSVKLNAQLETVLKYFDPKKVLMALQKQTLDQVPTYLQLYDKFKSTKDSLDYANLHMATMKAEIVSEMEKSFEKFNSYESVMEDLKFKNEELRLSVQEKEELLKQNSKKISSKQDLIETIRQEAEFHLQHLSQEILSLKEQVASFEHLQSKQLTHNPMAVYVQQIEELQRKLYEKEIELDQLSSSFEEKVYYLESQNRNLKETIEQAKVEEAAKLEEYIIRLNDIQKERDDQRQLIQLLNSTVRDQNQSIEQLTKELGKRSQQITQILRKRKKIEDEFRMNQQNLKANLNACSQELEHLRQKIKIHEGQKGHSRKFSFSQKSMTSNEQQNSKQLTRVMSGGSSFKDYPISKNLMIDLTQELNPDEQDYNANTDFGYYQPSQTWSQKYHNLLAKHNQFIKLVFSRLRNINPYQ